MKIRARKLFSLLLIAALTVTSVVATSCKGSQKTMYERKKNNKGATVKSNIKVRGNSNTHGYTTRSY